MSNDERTLCSQRAVNVCRASAAADASVSQKRPTVPAISLGFGWLTGLSKLLQSVELLIEHALYT
jgi:hypothetical protein